MHTGFYSEMKYSIENYHAEADNRMVRYFSGGGGKSRRVPSGSPEPDLCSSQPLQALPSTHVTTRHAPPPPSRSSSAVTSPFFLDTPEVPQSFCIQPADGAPVYGHVSRPVRSLSTVKSMGSGTRPPGFASQLCHLGHLSLLVK